jgi:hypothetical protein
LSEQSLFIYWHVSVETAAAAAAAALAYQTLAQNRWPGLQARLYRRTDPDRDRVTLMETYACSRGLPSDLAADSAAALASWAAQGRHVETFEPVNPGL